MIISIISVALLFVVGWSLTLFPWPPLDSGITTTISQMVRWLYSFDEIIPIITAFKIGTYILAIEFGMFVFRLFGQIYGAITGHKAPTDKSR